MQHQESPPNGSPVAIGIDFGTSKCCVAAVRDGRAHVFENEFGQRTTPSWVAFNSQQRLVGGAALDQAVVNCANTVSGVKRTLGRTYDDVKGLPSTCKIKKCYTNRNFQYCVNYRKRQLQLSPEQITAMMLTKMKDVAETSLGRPVMKAVISVPACYGNAQRAAIMNAAKVAGLEVLQLINETTAAGIVFEDNRSVKTPVTIAVVDFGAGKLDISVMEVDRKSIKVIGASGSPFLGGCDVDEVLVDHCVKFIQQKFGNKVEINDKVGIKLRLACEKAKKTLSLLPEAQVCIESIVEDSDITIPVSRQDIYELLDGEIRKTIRDNFLRIFEKNSMNEHKIDKIVLVGGSTRFPVVKKILEEYFGSHKLDQTVNQDEAVAQGAALRAAALSGAVTGIEVADVSSFDVYFSRPSQNKNKLDKIINKFSTIPSISSHKFNETLGTKIRFFERMNRFDGSKCDTDLLTVEFIGSTFNFTRWCNAELTLRLDESGIFSISIPSPSDESKLRLVPVASHYSHEITSWVKEEKKFRNDAKTEMERVDAEVELESLCYGVQSVLNELELMEDISHDELETSEKAVSNAMKWMTNNIETAPLNEIQQKINRVNNVKKAVDRMMNTARKKAIEKEEAAKKQAAVELLNEEILAVELDLSGLVSALEVSNFVMELSPTINQCKNFVSSLMTWKKNIESASLTEVSHQLEELNQMKREVDQLKADAAREKARLEEEQAAREQAEMELFNSLMSDCLSLLSEVNSMLDDTNLATYSDSQSLHSCACALRSLVDWKENIQTASAAQVSVKLKELTELKNKIHRLKEYALEKARLEEEKTARIQAEVDLFNALVSNFASNFSEVRRVLQMLNLDSCSDTSTLELCNARLRSLKACKENMEKATPTEVSKKLGELTRVKNMLDQLNASRKAKLEEDVTKTMLTPSHVEQPTYLHGSCNDSFPNVRTSRNVAMNSINEKRKLNNSNRERSSNSFNTSSGSVEPSLVSSASNHDQTERGRSKSVSRPATEEEGHRSGNKIRSPSVGVTNERGSCLESGQSFKRFQPSENLKNGQPSLSRSRQNFVDDLAQRRSISCNVLVGQNGEPRSFSQSCQPFGNEDIDHRSRTFLNSEEKVGERRRSSRELSSSRSRQPSEHKDANHRSRTPHNSEEKEGEQKVPYRERSSSRSRQPSEYKHMVHRSRTPHKSEEKEGEHKVPNRERSSSRSRHGSAISKERRPVGPGSSLEGEHHHQPKPSCEGTASEGPHLHQRGSSDKCTEQPTSARGAGSSWDSMRKWAVGNSVTLPNKHTPWIDPAASKGYDSSINCQSKETQIASTATSARTQTDMALLDNGREYGNDTSSNDELKELSVEEEEKITKFKNLGFLLPLLQIVDNTMSYMANCESCMTNRFPCPHHRSEGLKELGRMLDTMPEILRQESLAETGEVNVNQQTTATLKPAENGASHGYTTSNYNWKDNGLSNGSVDSVQGPAAVSHQSSTGVYDTHSLLGWSFPTPEGPARVNKSYVPVYHQLGRSPARVTRSHNNAARPYHRSPYPEKLNTYVPQMAVRYENLNKK